LEVFCAVGFVWQGRCEDGVVDSQWA
jgi:hypothetical protein